MADVEARGQGDVSGAAAEPPRARAAAVEPGRADAASDRAAPPARVGGEVRLAPGPKGVPLFGNLFAALRDPLALFLESRARFGDVVRFRFGPFDYYLLADPDAVHHVLVDNAKAYTKSRNYIGLKVVLGEGLLTSEGEHWRRQRKLAQPAFHREQLAGFAQQMSGATRDLLRQWRERGETTTCIHRELMQLTFRIVGLTLFSSDVAGDAKDVGEALDVALMWVNDYAESLFPIPPRIPTPANLRLRKAKKTLDEVVFRIIRDRRAAAGAGSDLLGMLMASRDETGAERMSDTQLRDEVITMVLAGHETTANLLAWTFYLLSKHPDVERRVRAEVSEVLGDREPELGDMKALELTRRVLEETLRLFPPAWTFERQSTADDRIGGFDVKKGSIVGVCPYVLHRHPGLWQNPEGFDPDRFLPSRAAERPRYAYLPFGGGPRTCIGNHFAMMEAQIILAMILREWKVDLDPAHRVIADPLVTLRPRHGIQVSLRRAERGSSGCPAPRTPSAPRAAPS